MKDEGHYALSVKQQEDATRFYIERDIFNQEELHYLANVAKQAHSDAIVGGKKGEGRLEKTIRISKVHFLKSEKTSEWVFKRIAKYVENINEEFFKYELSHIAPIQLANYKGNEKGNYNWHMDCGSGPIRKLSVALQLNDPNEYEGGEFLFMRGSKEEKIPKEKGLAVFFPSFLVHKVTPVTSGERQSLVCWVNGSRPFS